MDILVVATALGSVIASSVSVASVAGVGGGVRLAGVVVGLTVLITTRCYGNLRAIVCIVSLPCFFVLVALVLVVELRSSYNFTSERYEGVGSHIASSPAVYSCAGVVGGGGGGVASGGY